MSSINKQQILTLYRSLLREASKFSQYSYRSYAYTRVRDYFRELRGLNDAKEIDKAVHFAQDNLKILKRQVLINTMYSTDKLIIENSKGK